MNIQIHTYNPNSGSEPINAFFILNKGLNSGRPMKRPCANCFVVVADTFIDRDKLYGYCYLLFRSEVFSQCLVGSVIPFLRIDDFRKVLFDTILNPNIDHIKINIVMKNVLNYVHLRDNLHSKIKLLKTMEDSYIRKYIKL